MGPGAGVSAPPLILAGELPGAGGGFALAAAVAVALATTRDRAPVAGGDGTVVLVEVGLRPRRGPTMLAAEGARELERSLREAGLAAAARGRIAWLGLGIDGEPPWTDAVGEVLAAASGAGAALVFAPVDRWRELLSAPVPGPRGAVLRADLPRQRSLAALAVGELRGAGLRVRIASRPPGRVAARRAISGIDPGGECARRSRRLARGLLPDRDARPLHRLEDPRVSGEAGQATPLIVGLCLALVASALALAAFGGALSGKSRGQRAADLAALSGARSMRDDFPRLFVAARTADGSANPAHLSKRRYLARASAAVVDAARRNGVAAARVRVGFPDRDSFAPLHVRARIVGELELGTGASQARAGDVAVSAEAEAVPPTAPSAATSGGSTHATGGGYSGPLEHRGGEGMRPDVAAAFDRMSAAAAAAGYTLYVNSGFRSDAEQAVLWAANPDPRWVAPPGTSLHRCATELDLGPEAAYGWLAANAERFGFVQRYSWEAWHYGYVGGPAPCSQEGDAVATAPQQEGRHAEGGDGASASASLPGFVPAAYRDAIAAASAGWNVPAALLAAQLMAESNFNPFAVSPAGAAGIAQFMPATAASYGLADPFDAVAAIDAQAHLMSDLLGEFGGDVSLALAAYNAGPAPVAACSCVPAYPETQAYVARILGLVDGAGAGAATGVAAPALEVRLVD